MNRLAASALLCLLAAGSAQAAGKPPALPGGDADAHGCRASAGYSWCARTKNCERPWELAAQRGFANTAEAFDRFCARR